MELNSSIGRALLTWAVVSQAAGCAPRCSREDGSGRADAVPAKEAACASGWAPVGTTLCVRFSGMERGDEPPVDLVAFRLVSKTDYAHLGLRVAVLRGAERWCAFPTTLSLAQIEANHDYDFRVPCSMSGKPIDRGEFRLAVEIDEAIEKHTNR